MFSHSQIWQAIDRLAEANGMSASGLARAAGLDATAFNKSKRATPHGRLRWPTTESVSKCLAATRTSLNEFAGLVHGAQGLQRTVPCIHLAYAGANDLFDDAGRPAGDGWDRINMPGIDDPCAYALTISGDTMMPVYRDGDTVIVSPAAPVRPGDRVVVKTGDGEILARRLHRETGKKLELACFDPQQPMLTIERTTMKWMARIIWTSQ
ncbi:MAG: helix-turn-helix transcriptional regulator [Anderseniella sp.]